MSLIKYLYHRQRHLSACNVPVFLETMASVFSYKIFMITFFVIDDVYSDDIVFYEFEVRKKIYSICNS